MNLEKLIKVIRKGLDDEAGPDANKLWQDEEIVEYINRAIREICKELWCLTADDDVAETLAAGTITLSGTAGQVSSVSVNGVTITSGSVAFTTDLATTASAVASNINAWAVNPLNTNAILFTASADGAVVTITAPANTGSTPNGYAITATVSGGMSFISTTMSGGACLCRMFLIPGQTKYQMHRKTILISRFKTGARSRPLDPSTKKQLDASSPGWENSTSGTPYTFIPDYKGKKVTVVPPPDTADTANLDVVRLPYVDLNLSDLTAEPEIADDYQDPIVPWAKREAFLKDDVETNDTARSQKFEAEFYRMIEQIKEKLDIPQEPNGGCLLNSAFM